MVREKIAQIVQESIESLQKKKALLQFPLPDSEISHPKEESHGDYASNVALKVGKIVKKKPMEIGKSIKSEILSHKPDLFEKIEVVKPGFINFFLSKEFLQKELKEILEKGEKYGKVDVGKKEKVNVEFISANPTGPLHIGNGRGAFLGDALSGVLEWAGYKVVREYYINDAKVNSQIRTLGQTALGKGTTYLTDDLKAKIKKLKPRLEKMSDEGEAGYLLGQEVHKDIKNFIEKKLKIQYDNWFPEESLYQKSKVDKIYNLLKKKNLLYKKEGAQWVKTSKFGDLKDRVGIRETGMQTYLFSDTAYHQDKFDRGFQRVINIWGADHQGHVLKMKAVAKILDFKGDLDIIIVQLVRLKRGKLSKREGRIITLEHLVDEVGLDAARFFYLMKAANTQMEFDIELAKERSKRSPVYYVQYAHARICSILRKVKNLEVRIQNLGALKHSSELALIKQLMRLPEIIEDTSRDYQVQRLPQYAMDLATTFHQFYRDCQVLSENKEEKEARLALISATKLVLQNTLGLIGVSAPQKM